MKVLLNTSDKDVIWNPNVAVVTLKAHEATEVVDNSVAENILQNLEFVKDVTDVPTVEGIAEVAKNETPTEEPVSSPVVEEVVPVEVVTTEVIPETTESSTEELVSSDSGSEKDVESN